MKHLERAIDDPLGHGAMTCQVMSLGSLAWPISSTLSSRIIDSGVRRGSAQPGHPGALRGRRRHRRRRVVLPLDRGAHRRWAGRLRRQRRGTPAASSSRPSEVGPTDPFSHVIYTHGHVDHVGRQRGVRRRRRCSRRRPADVPRPRERPAPASPATRCTNDWNLLINRRQFGWLPADRGMGIGGRRTLPARRRRRARRHLPRRADRRCGRHGDPPHPRPRRDRRPHVGVAARAAGRRASATCSSGTSRTPATRRRCSATRRSGRAALRSIIARRAGAAPAGPRPADRRAGAHRRRARRRAPPRSSRWCATCWR